MDHVDRTPLPADSPEEIRTLEAIRDLVGLATEKSRGTFRGRAFTTALRTAIDRLSTEDWEAAHEGLAQACEVLRARRRTGAFKWVVNGTQHYLTVQRGDRALAVAVLFLGGTKGWNAVAAESASNLSTVGAFFQDHAHQVIAEGVSFTKAQEQGEAFARAWLAGASLAPCPCTDIDPQAAAPSLALASPAG